MNKKLTFGKFLGIIFCILAAAGTVVLLCVNAYFSGQMKLIDKFYTAIERDDFEGYKACFSEASQEFVTDERFEYDKDSIASVFNDNKKVHIKAKFVKREKNYFDEDTIYYCVTVDATVYTDNSKEVEHFLPVYIISRENGKWVIWG